jgi:hypothetical protein
LWLSAGVGKSESAGSEDVKCHDFGRAASVTPSLLGDEELLLLAAAMAAGFVKDENDRLQGPRNCWEMARQRAAG